MIVMSFGEYPSTPDVADLIFAFVSVFVLPAIVEHPEIIKKATKNDKVAIKFIFFIFVSPEYLCIYPKVKYTAIELLSNLVFSKCSLDGA